MQYVILAIQKSESSGIAGYAHMQGLILHVFPHLLEHWTSFQLFCRYVKYGMAHYVECYNIYKCHKRRFCHKATLMLQVMAKL